MATIELLPASQREGGAALGSVVNHTYTDGKDNDLIHWLPNQLAHNLEKRSTLMQLEAFVSEYVASNDWMHRFSVSALCGLVTLNFIIIIIIIIIKQVFLECR